MKFRPMALAALVAIFALPGTLFPAKAPSLLNQSDAWFKSDTGRKTIDNILSWQGHGPGGVMDWPKSYDVSEPRPADGSVEISWHGVATIDNDATHSELRILARAISLESPGPRQDKIKTSFYKGLEALIGAQYANGGWPQRFPPGQESYDARITFNDDAMTKVMELLKDVAAGAGPFAFVDDDHRKSARASLDKGIDCTLKCQIIAGGKLTVWCAQHDEKTLAAAKGRAYELPSLSGAESAEITMFLMSIDKPDERIKKSVEAAYAWFEAVKFPNKTFRHVFDPQTRQEIDRVLADAPGVTSWARFYEIGTNKPIFSGRDSVLKYNLADIEFERRTGYGWYGTWGQKVLDEYPKWKERMGG